MNNQPRVLVVDDEERFRNNLIRLLESEGFPAEGAATGEDALNILGRQGFDVVLLDVKMPGLTGVGVMKEIHRREVPVEVIFLTGHASVDDAMEGLKQGAVDYLLKPCPRERLIPKVLSAYERKVGKNRPLGH